MEGYALSPTGEEIPVKMWECDTVTQAKEKILDAIYKVPCVVPTHTHGVYTVHSNFSMWCINVIVLMALLCWCQVSL